MSNPAKAPKMFFVAMSKMRPGCGGATCVDDTHDKQSRGRIVRSFFREYAGREIRHVDGEEMRRLMTIEPADTHEQA